MGEWAAKAFERLKGREGNTHALNQREAEERHKIETAAPLIWVGLRSVIRKEINDFNQLRPGHLVVDDREEIFRIIAPDHEVVVTFYNEDRTIKYKVEGESAKVDRHFGEFSFVLNRDGEVRLQLKIGLGTQDFDPTGRPLEIAEVAEFLLDKVV